MIKFSCSMISGADIFYATLIAEDAKQAKEMAAAETKKGRPREWSVAVLEPEVPVPRHRRPGRVDLAARGYRPESKAPMLKVA